MQKNVNRKYTIEEVREEITQYGGELLSTEYKNNKQKLLFRCKYDHIFSVSFDHIKRCNVWCKECGTFNAGETICRIFLEDLFGKPFPRYRNDWLRNDAGFKLEFDGYCEDLGIAFEHNGIQHYQHVEYFGGNRFQRLVINDLKKMEICKERDIKLLIIPQLFTITKFSSFKDVVKNELIKNNIAVPDSFDTLRVNKVKISKNDYCAQQLELASQLAIKNEGKLLSTEFIHSHEDFTWQCKNNHTFNLSFTGAKQGIWCRYCHFDNLKLDVSHITYEKLYELHYTQKLSAHNISQILMISPQIIRRLISKYNIPKNKSAPKPSLDISYNELYDLYITQNKTIPEISKYFDCTRGAVMNQLSNYNIIKNKIVLDIGVLTDLYQNKNMTVRQIAKIYNENENMITVFLSENKIKKIDLKSGGSQ